IELVPVVQLVRVVTIGMAAARGFVGAGEPNARHSNFLIRIGFPCKFLVQHTVASRVQMKPLTLNLIQATYSLDKFTQTMDVLRTKGMGVLFYSPKRVIAT